jgi:hypothetical protein
MHHDTAEIARVTCRGLQTFGRGKPTKYSTLVGTVNRQELTMQVPYMQQSTSKSIPVGVALALIQATCGMALTLPPLAEGRACAAEQAAAAAVISFVAAVQFLLNHSSAFAAGLARSCRGGKRRSGCP